MQDAGVAQLMALFERVLETPRERRAEVLDQVSGGNTALREELASLLDAHDSASGYFEHLAGNVVSPAYAAIIGGGRRANDPSLLDRLEAALESTYRVRRELGGGMSRVFLAEEIKLDRKVVIKVLPPETASGASADRFRREIQLAAQLQHPHIVPLLTTDSADSLLYYTMPFVAGESLRVRLAREGPLLIRDAREIWRDVLEALAHAHANGVVHRDIKPGNILLNGRSALVSDFGIARAIEAAGGDPGSTAPGFLLGTPAYMAPEQVEVGHSTDHRADIYSTGLVMYEMLEGHLPFSGDSARDLMLARLTRDAAPLTRDDCPPELARLVLDCLATDPEARPKRAEDVVARLDSIPITSERAAVTTRSPMRRKARRLAYGAVLTAAIVAAAFMASSVIHRRGDDAASGEVATAMPSIAVLPLRNLSADAADASLADGMTEELIAMLSRSSGMRVIASGSVLSLSAQHMNVRQIAESLHVSYALDGTLQKSGSRVRLQLRLVDGRDASTRWTETYDRDMEDIFAVQDEVARSVMRELDARFAAAPGPTRRSMPRRYVPSIEAYEWYLRGMDPANSRTRAGRERAREYFSRAIAADSNFAAPYAGLVEVLVLDAGTAPDNQRASFARAREAAEKAVSLDPSLAEAHVALGRASIVNRNWSVAETELRRAIEIDPNVPRAFDELALLYLYTGKRAEQLSAARAGVAVDPLSPQANARLAFALAMNGRPDDGLAQLRPLKKLNPPVGLAGVIAGQCYAVRGMWREATAEFRWAMEAGEARMGLPFLAYALARSGQRDEATKILGDLLSGREYNHGAFGIATVYTGLGDYDNALKWLEKSAEEESLRPYVMGPMFDEVRRDPRFARVKARIGL